MGILDFLFGKSESTKNNAFETKSEHDIIQHNDNHDFFVQKFLCMVVTEQSREAPNLEQVTGIVNEYFKETDSGNLFTLTTQLITMHDLAAKTTIAGDCWDEFFSQFCNQISKYPAQAKKEIIQEIMWLCLNFKNDSEMADLAETLIYRSTYLESRSGFDKATYINYLEQVKKDFSNKKNSKSRAPQSKSQKVKPDYFLKAEKELHQLTRETSDQWKPYEKNLTWLIGRADFNNTDSEFLEDQLGHGRHKNFQLLKLSEISKICAKAILKQGYDKKQAFKSAESALLDCIRKWKKAYEHHEGIKKSLK